MPKLLKKDRFWPLNDQFSTFLKIFALDFSEFSPDDRH